jgi:uncharacterized integral membrane protein
VLQGAAAGTRSGLEHADSQLNLRRESVMSETTRPGRLYLLIEVGLILALIVLAIFIYWRPAADGALSPPWWHWPLLAILFFGVVGLHTWRKKQEN